MNVTGQGEALADMLDALDMTISEAAEWARMPEPVLRGVVQGKHVLTRGMVDRLQSIPGVTEKMALDLWDMA